jgi:hypothetical protein
MFMLQKAVSSELQDCSEFGEVCVAAAVAAVGTGHVSCSQVCALLTFVCSKCCSYLQSNRAVAVALTRVISACSAVVILPSEGINMSAGLAKFTSLYITLNPICIKPRSDVFAAGYWAWPRTTGRFTGLL